MKKKPNVQFTPFADGSVAVYSVTNRAAAGDRPVNRLTFKYRLGYTSRVVGYKRFYAAKEAQREVDLAVLIPLRTDILAGADVAIINGQQYRIDKITQLLTNNPPACELTLWRLEKGYDL